MKKKLKHKISLWWHRANLTINCTMTSVEKNKWIDAGIKSIKLIGDANAQDQLLGQLMLVIVMLEN